GESFEIEYRIVAGTGELRSLHGLGRRESSGQYVGTVQDVTERRSIERSLIDAEELLALAFDQSPLGMTLSTPDRGVLRINQAFADMLGYSVQELIADQHSTGITHPDDHAADRDNLRLLLDEGENDRQWDKRYLRAGGHTVWARVSVSVLRHPDGSPRLLVSQIEDITERRQHEAEERALRDVAELVAAGAEPAIVFNAIAEQVRELFDTSASAVVRFDALTSSGVMLGASASDGADLVGTTFDLHSATASAEVFRTGHPARIDALDVPAEDPVSKTVQRFGLTGSIATPIHVSGELWGVVGVASDQQIAVGAELRLERFAHLASLAITNLQALETLEHRAATDPLTGIANHRTFYDRLTSEFERARRYGRDLSVVLLDLDHFKAINDAHGHQTGDRILKEVAQRLAGEARVGELVARIGGEEFAWLIPESDQHVAYAAAERVRRAIERTPFADVGTVTLSAGVCSTTHARDAHQLMHNADRALYRAKEHGRNNTSVDTAGAHAAGPLALPLGGKIDGFL
ncbi:MAG TPA: diguanylate cyclase, partial [Solirubrobacteraceae bacterium]|nr:diguanylate cyclase [Solirubrobacteraceae bacterium]